MIPGQVKDTILELQKYNLGSRYPSSEVQKMLKTEMRVPLVCHWNSDGKQWEVYREKDSMLIWQISLPKNMNVLTLNLKQYLERYDSSKFGTRNDEERQKDFALLLKNSYIPDDKERKKKSIEEMMYRQRDINVYLNNKFVGAKQAVVPAGPVVGHVMKKGKRVEIRAYKTLREKGVL